VSLDATQTVLLRRALQLAAIARAAGNPPFGSLVADEAGAVLAEDYNTTTTDDDVTAHPELKLARWAARTLTAEQIEHATLFTSCEPCPMCTNAIERARIPRVIYALSNSQLAGLKPAGTPPPSVAFRSKGPYLEDESIRPVAGYYAQRE
jgi:tRNA(Arg) A34 adenosine deaminase TadA